MGLRQSAKLLKISLGLTFLPGGGRITGLRGEGGRGRERIVEVDSSSSLSMSISGATCEYS